MATPLYERLITSGKYLLLDAAELKLMLYLIHKSDADNKVTLSGSEAGAKISLGKQRGNLALLHLHERGMLRRPYSYQGDNWEITL